MPKKIYNNTTMDARPDRLDLRDREYRPPLHPIPQSWPLQEDIDRLFQKYIKNDMILNQGGEGECTGYGLATVINYLIWRDNLELDSATKVSPQMLYRMARIYDEWDDEDYEGSSCRGAMKGWHRQGVCTQKSWCDKIAFEELAKEATQNSLGAYYRINKDSIVDMQAAIKEVGAIYCSAIIHQKWWEVKGKKRLPIIQYDQNSTGGHAFAIVGYNAVGFIVQNSWGKEWGFQGFAILTYSDWLKNGSDAWVAVIGASVRLKQIPITFSSFSLQVLSTSHINQNLNNRSKTAQWSEDKAYQHSLVIGNNGRPKSTIIYLTPENSANVICYENIKSWMKESVKNRKIVIYGHGGLTNEKANIKRTSILAPYFKANNIYPIFITWKTGFLESITYQIEDKIREIFLGANIEPSSSIASKILKKFKDGVDRSIENIAREIIVKGIWSQMKENAKFASDRAVPNYSQQGGVKPGGMVILAEKLKQLKDEFNCEVHLIGHSAGSILFGHWMDELVKRELKIESISLYAPVCTMEFTNKHYIKAWEKGIFKKEKMSIHLLDDTLEQEDNVGPYNKSLSYLVSRALEDAHKMPLLGLMSAWSVPSINDAIEEQDKFNSAKHIDIKKWLKFSGNDVKCVTYVKYLSKVKTSVNGDYINFKHGSFDNDIQIIEETIKQIKGVDKLEHRVENLNGY